MFELLEMTESMMVGLKSNNTALFAEAALNSPGFVPLAKVALTYAKMGITSVDEVLKLIEMVAEERSSNNAEEQEVPLEVELAEVTGASVEQKISSDKAASKFAFELEPLAKQGRDDDGAV